MRFHNKTQLHSIAAEKTVYKNIHGDKIPHQYDAVINITDWEDGIIEIMLEDGNTYYRIQHTDLERSITAARINKIE